MSLGSGGSEVPHGGPAGGYQRGFRGIFPERARAADGMTSWNNKIIVASVHLPLHVLLSVCRPTLRKMSTWRADQVSAWLCQTLLLESHRCGAVCRPSLRFTPSHPSMLLEQMWVMFPLSSRLVLESTSQPIPNAKKLLWQGIQHVSAE